MAYLRRRPRPFFDGAGRNLNRKMLGRGRGAVIKLDTSQHSSHASVGWALRLGERHYHVPRTGAVDGITVLGETQSSCLSWSG